MDILFKIVKFFLRFLWNFYSDASHVRNSVEDQYYFDGNGQPYNSPQSSPYLDAREGW